LAVSITEYVNCENSKFVAIVVRVRILLADVGNNVRAAAYALDEIPKRFHTYLLLVFKFHVYSNETKKSNIEVWLEQSSSDEDYIEDGDAESHPHYLPDHDSSSSDLTDHWYIQKLIRYVKVDHHIPCQA
jgi:hypothetical protein